MPPKRRGRKKKNGVANERKERLKILISEFDEKVEITVGQTENECEELCSKLREKYDWALYNIPEKFHDLTKEDYNNQSSKTPPSIKPLMSALSAVQTQFQCLTERKALRAAALTARKVKSNSKKSVDNTCKRYAAITGTITKSSTARPKPSRRPLASVQQINTPMNQRKATLLTTPISRSAPKQKVLVTPKFDPRLPLPNMLLRKPRANEVIMSLSGSPLQNPAASENDKPEVLFSVGGKMLNLADVSELNSISIDNQAKETLKLVQERLARMINN